jgi:hypothetical protein
MEFWNKVYNLVHITRRDRIGWVYLAMIIKVLRPLACNVIRNDKVQRGGLISRLIEKNNPY